jgi:hypothetical protein
MLGVARNRSLCIAYALLPLLTPGSLYASPSLVYPPILTTRSCPGPAAFPPARLVAVCAMASAAYSSPMSGPYAEIKVAVVGLHPRRPARRLNSFAVLLKSHGARDARDARWEELARTETVSGDASPAFVESFEVPLLDRKSDRAELVVALFQKTARSDELRKNALLGYARFSVAKVRMP